MFVHRHLWDIVHFRREDFTLPPDIKGESPGKKRRLKPGAVPSIFSFRQELPSRPSPADRRADALARIAALSLPQFGPQTEVEATKAQLEVLRSRVREQDDIYRTYEGRGGPFAQARVSLSQCERRSG